jgi:hypothetical protein
MAGALRGRPELGAAGFGDDTTGFDLKDVTIEVDMSAIKDARDLVGKEIVVEGRFELETSYSRGDVWVFRADSVVED